MKDMFAIVTGGQHSKIHLLNKIKAASFSVVVKCHGQLN